MLRVKMISIGKFQVFMKETKAQSQLYSNRLGYNRKVVHHWSELDMVIKSDCTEQHSISQWAEQVTYTGSATHYFTHSPSVGQSGPERVMFTFLVLLFIPSNIKNGAWETFSTGFLQAQTGLPSVFFNKQLRNLTGCHISAVTFFFTHYKFHKNTTDPLFRLPATLKPLLENGCRTLSDQGQPNCNYR